jgi:hypothetical protein
MKINKTTIFLLLALVGVWVFIGSLVYNAMKEPMPVSSNSKKKKPEKKVQAEKGFELLLNYDNPFITTASTFTPRKNDNQQIAKPVAKQAVKQPAKPVSAPLPQTKLQYLGYMQFKSKGKQQLLLKVNGQEQIFDKGDEVYGYTIRKISVDSLILKKGKELRVLIRE